MTTQPDAEDTGATQRRLLVPLLLAVAALALTGMAWYATQQWMLADFAGRAGEHLLLRKDNVVAAVERYRYLPAVAARDGRILRLVDDKGDAAAVDLANRYLEAANGLAGSRFLYVLDPTGTALASSNWRDTANSLVGRNYGIRPYFKDAMAQGSARYYAKGLTTGEAGYFVAARIGTADEPAGVVVVKVDLSPLERAWQAASERVALVDRAGMIFLSSVDDWRFRPLYPLSPEDRRRILEEKQYDPETLDRPPLLADPGNTAGQDLSLPLQGRPTAARILPVEAEGWRILVAYDVADVALWAGLVALAVFLASALLLAAGFYWRERGRRIQSEGLRSILENMSVGIAVFDGNLCLQAWNQKYRQLNRYPDDLVRAGRPLADIIRHNIARGDFGPVDAEKELQKRLGQAREPAAQQIELRRPDGTWVELRRSRMPDGRFIRIYADITERKGTEAALADYKTNLERLVDQRTAELVLANERLQIAVAQTEAEKRRVEQASRAKTTFLKAASHDIRNPLNAILGFAGLVMANARDRLPPRQYANLEKLAAKGRELIALVEDLLDYTRADHVSLTAFRLLSVVEECRSTCEPAIATDRVRIVTDIPAGLPGLVQDERKLKRIIINLLSNAAKFTERGTIRVSATSRDGIIEITVADTGIGIAAEHLERIFDEFERVEPPGQRPREGTGLGLAICRRFAGLMGGKVGVQSRSGEGSVFTLSIPVIHPTATAGVLATGNPGTPSSVRAAIADPPAGGTSSRKATVLVVDDSQDNRDYLTQLLEARYRIVVAADGQRAIEVACAERPDIILMDLTLPRVDGWEATRRIRSDPALLSIPIVAVTAHGTPRDRAAFASAGGGEFLSKPVDETELFDILRRHLGPRSGGNP